MQEQAGIGAVPDVSMKKLSFGSGEDKGCSLSVVREFFHPASYDGGPVRRVEPNTAKPWQEEPVHREGIVMGGCRPRFWIRGSAGVEIEGPEGMQDWLWGEPDNGVCVGGLMAAHSFVGH
ncbi:hypothetical protein GCM10019059_42140 [Camelimonas fluminis]|nr:hypothetical protein GCM10019059_42140 [Camelimonas fluminis]